MCKKNPFKGTQRIYYAHDKSGKSYIVGVGSREMKTGGFQVISSYHPHTSKNLKAAERVVGKGKIKNYNPNSLEAPVVVKYKRY